LNGSEAIAKVHADAEACGRFVSEREANDLAHAIAFRAERQPLQHEQIARLPDRLPLPQIQLPFLFTPDIGRPQVDALATPLARAVGGGGARSQSRAAR